jgi:predicted nucleic acid-binding protein
MESLPRRGQALSLVLDSSVALAWIFPDETNDPIKDLFAEIGERGAVVPTHWRLEIANGLTVAVRRGRIDAGLRSAALADLALLSIEIDANTNQNAWSKTLAFADHFGLTLYDAAYLELAQRRSLPLASLDKPLRAAAAALRISTLGV